MLNLGLDQRDFKTNIEITLLVVIASDISNFLSCDPSYPWIYNKSFYHVIFIYHIFAS